MRKSWLFLLCPILLLLLYPIFVFSDDNLPIQVPELPRFEGHYYPPNVVSFEKLHNIVGGNKDGLILDLENKELWGNIHTGPFPFEAGDSSYDHDRYALSGKLENGKGTLPIAKLYSKKYDANDWNKGGLSTVTPTIAYRLELFAGKKSLGMYGGLVSFQRKEDGTFSKLPTIVEGPFVTSISSDNPNSIVFVWETDVPCKGVVICEGKEYNGSDKYTKKHSIEVSGLEANKKYKYFVRSHSQKSETVTSNTYSTRTAPEKGEGDVSFIFSTDSRSGTGGGERAYMGHNLYIMKKLAAAAHRRKADFFFFGGDLVNGMNQSNDLYISELKAWKKGVAGYWNQRPVYTSIGNHEFGWAIYNQADSPYPVWLDRWPYDTQSGESVFASELFNFSNGPKPSDSRRPTYKENVYSFQHGPAYVITFNNTYWWTGQEYKTVQKYGGSPIGYVMEDQLDWIAKEVKKADADPTVKCIFLICHSPVFPAMKHVAASMWYNGDNNVRAYSKNKKSGKLEPARLGIVEVRNHLWETVSSSPKVAAVLTGDEHAYHRTRIDKKTPVGVYPEDDTDKDGKLDKYSVNPKFKYPTWHVTLGGAGAPFVANLEKTPWKVDRITSHYGYIHIEVKDGKAILNFCGGPTEEVVDSLDLLEIKK